MVDDEWISSLLEGNESEEIDNHNQTNTNWEVKEPSLQNTFLTIDRAGNDAWHIASDEISNIQ